MTAASLPPEKRTLDGQPPASFLGQLGWLFYEIAQGPYFVTIVIVVFAPYFSKVLVGDPTKGQVAWASVMGTAGLLVAGISPFVGAYIDAVGPRKPAIAITAFMGIAAMFGLWFAVPGEPGAVMLASILIVICAVTMEIAGNSHNALLPSIMSVSRVGLYSGLGYGVGYFAALATTVIWLVLFSWPEVPALGLSRDTHEVERIIGPLCAIWTLAFMLPLLLFTRDQAPTGLGMGTPAIRQSLSSLKALVLKLKDYRNILYFLLARTIYYDGVVVTSSMMAVYATGIFGWSVETVTVYGACALVLTGLGASLGGFVDDAIGPKRTVMLVVALFFCSLLGNLGVTPDAILYMSITPEQAASQIPGIGNTLTSLGFVTLPEQVFVLIGFLGALTGGSAMAASRTVMARISPPEQAAQFFGLYTLTGKATAFSLPFIIAFVTDLTQSQRLGLAPALVYLLVGGLAMFAVKVERSEATTAIGK